MKLLVTYRMNFSESYRYGWEVDKTKCPRYSEHKRLNDLDKI